ncbi:Crp/Fnr family transcriptional regulator [Gangjinia marincola]|uniref:Crp/Fnr family transcriptional regulator n=1 Tax=Gangjinia marincola TaxID=578463 RepID=A0ABP3XWN5_9FLAO
MHSFKTFISKYVNLPEKEWLLIKRELLREEFPKGHLILREGEVCKNVYFLEKGLLRYFIHNSGEEVTKFFTIPPYCFTSIQSFSNQKPSKENIETLEKSIVYTMSKSSSDRLMELDSWNQFVLKLIEEVQFFTENILVSLQNQTAEERYAALIEKESELFINVPLKHIASYLGIKPQSLSRIRKKFIQNLKS